jgi:hypothetical protein
MLNASICDRKIFQSSFQTSAVLNIKVFLYVIQCVSSKNTNITQSCNSCVHIYRICYDKELPQNNDMAEPPRSLLRYIYN